MPLCVCVPGKEAKAVKDYLKKQKWLDATYKPGKSVAHDGCLAFPLVDGASEAVQAAWGSGDEAALQAVVGIEEQSLASANKAPSQKDAAARAAFFDKEPPPTARNATESAPTTSHQPRCFGSGRRSAATGVPLPPAAAVRIVVPPAGVGEEDLRTWFSETVVNLGTPALVRGLELGKCVKAWDADRLAATDTAGGQPVRSDGAN